MKQKQIEKGHFIWSPILLKERYLLIAYVSAKIYCKNKFIITHKKLVPKTASRYTATGKDFLLHYWFFLGRKIM